MTLGVVLDGVVAVLLVAMIVASILFNRRLSELRARHGKFATLIASFGVATERAEAGLARLHQIRHPGGDALDERIEAARALCDELAFLVERGAPLAGRLAGGTRAHPDAELGPSRRHAGLAPSSTKGDDERPYGDAADVSRSAVERDLVRALRAARGA